MREDIGGGGCYRWRVGGFLGIPGGVRGRGGGDRGHGDGCGGDGGGVEFAVVDFLLGEELIEGDDEITLEVTVDGLVGVFIEAADAVFDQFVDDEVDVGVAFAVGEGTRDQGGQDAEAAGGLDWAGAGGEDGFNPGGGQVDDVAEAGGGDVAVGGDAAVVFGDEFGVDGLPTGEGAAGDAQGLGDVEQSLAREEQIHGARLEGGEGEDAVAGVIFGDQGGVQGLDELLGGGERLFGVVVVEGVFLVGAVGFQLPWAPAEGFYFRGLFGIGWDIGVIDLLDWG